MTKLEEMEQKLKEMLKTISKEEMIKILEESGFEVKKSKKENSGKWKPAHGERFWFRDTYGEIEKSTWYNTLTDNHIFENTLLFRNEEACVEGIKAYLESEVE